MPPWVGPTVALSLVVIAASMLVLGGVVLAIGLGLRKARRDIGAKLALFTAGAKAEGDGQGRHEGRHGGHHDGPESDQAALVGMRIPPLQSGWKDSAWAQITEADCEFYVLACAVDMLQFPEHIRLVKIDVEGHEEAVIRGMRDLIERDHPILIVETESPNVISNLAAVGYTSKRFPESPNFLFLPSPGVEGLP